MIKVENLKKAFPEFSLKDISFSLPAGYILGFIGRNGAGKTTTLKCLLNLIEADSGKIEIFDKNLKEHETEIKYEIGSSIGEAGYYRTMRVDKIISVYRTFYSNFDDARLNELLVKFGIDRKKKISMLSTGMSIKLTVALALSHNAKLLILDEPTSGLDPVSRQEVVDIFREFISDGERSILFSTHITSDLDGCADYILMIQNGEIVLNQSKDEIIDGHKIVAGKLGELTDELKAKLIGYKTNEFGFTGLIKTEKVDKSLSELQVEKPNLESIMIFYDKEAHNA